MILLLSMQKIGEKDKICKFWSGSLNSMYMRSENLKWLLPKHWRYRALKFTETGSRIDLLLWWCAFVDGNHAVSQHQQWKWPSWGLSTPPCCSTDHVSSDQEIYIQVTNPSALIISSAVQNQSECYNDCDMVCMWQLCPKTHSVVLNLWRRQLLLPPHDAMNWLLLSTVQHILEEINLETGAFMARILISRRAHPMVSKRPSVQRKMVKSQFKEEDKKGSQDKELAAEGVQYEAEERWTAGLTLTHDFHLHYSSSIVLLYPKLYHFFY